MECDHYEREYNTYTIKIPGNSLSLASTVCLKCGEITPAPLEMCIDCFDLQPQPLRQLLHDAIVGGQLDGRCDVCLEEGILCLQFLL